MTADSQLAVQTAVLAALRGDGALTALLADGADSVLDHVPSETAYPYVVIGESTAGAFDSKSEQGMAQTLTLHTWSRYRGFKEAKVIMAAVAGALDRAGLSVSGHVLVDLRFEFAALMLDPDGLTRHGVQRFRALTQEA